MCVRIGLCSCLTEWMKDTQSKHYRREEGGSSRLRIKSHAHSNSCWTDTALHTNLCNVLNNRPTERPTNKSMKQELGEKVANILLTCRNVSIRIVIYTDLYTFTKNNIYTGCVCCCCCRTSFGINFIHNKSNLSLRTERWMCRHSFVQSSWNTRPNAGNFENRLNVWTFKTKLANESHINKMHDKLKRLSRVALLVDNDTYYVVFLLVRFGLSLLKHIGFVSYTDFLPLLLLLLALEKHPRLRSQNEKRQNCEWYCDKKHDDYNHYTS